MKVKQMFCLLKFHRLKTCQCFLASQERLDTAPNNTICAAGVSKELEGAPKLVVSVQEVPRNSTFLQGITTVDSGVPVFAVNGLLAEKAGFRENDEVYVELKTEWKLCTSVEVQPLSADDWEIVALNASKIENQLLDQLQIVQKGLVFPIWIDNILCIYLRVDEVSPSHQAFSCLQDGTEVLVAPFGNAGGKNEAATCGENSKVVEEDQPDDSVVFPEIDNFDCFNELITDCVEYCEIALHIISEVSFSLRFGHLLVCGSQGSGSSSVAVAICKRLYKRHFVYYEKVDCRTLRGKKVENVEKRLKAHLEECKKSSPAVLILDELDQLCSSGSSLEQLNPAGAILQARLAKMVLNLVESSRYSSGGGGCGDSRIMVIGTGESRNSFHPSLVASRGKRFFTEIRTIPNLTAEDRRKVFENVAGSEEEKDEFVRKTDGFVLCDLKHLLDRAVLMQIQRLTSASTTSREKWTSVEDFEKAMEGFKPFNLHNVGVDEEMLKYSWDDVGGMEEVKKVLVETLIWPAKYPNLYGSCPLRLARGILLYGPSGTGKTLIASAVAKESNLNFISVKGPELLSKYIGASEQSVRDTFARARRAKPCLIFFDEFEALAPRRGHDSTGVTDRVVNQLLTELDGVEALEGVFVLAASSRPDLLDPALLRPGRIDRFLYCRPPDKKERKEILQAISKGIILSEGVDFSEISGRTEGFTGADIKSLLFSAQIKAVHRLQEGLSAVVTQEDLLSALNETRRSIQPKPNQSKMSFGMDREPNTKPVSVGKRVTLA